MPNESAFHCFSYEGFPIHVKEYSRGLTEKPLVFIGGAFQNIQQIEKVSLALAKESWVIAVDTPGNGDTGVLPYSYDFEFICRAIHSAIKKLGIDCVNVLGCSYGSIVAMRYAQMYLGVDKLILGSAMEQLPRHLEYEFNLLLFLLKWNRMEEFADGFTNLLTNPDFRETNRLCRLTADKLRHALVNASTGMKEQFKHNTMRILKHGHTDLALMPDVDATVFTGEHDHFLPVSANQRVAASFKRSRFISIPDADHMFHVEQFRATVQTILSGLKDEDDKLELAA
nr:alpha/beta hydrolase [Kordiimonas marina]